MRLRLSHALALALPLVLTGCALQTTAPPTVAQGNAIRGNVHGGQQPIAGAHIYLFVANTTGYGQPSISLLNPALTGLSDSIGAYVLTDSGGGFTITGNYTCTSGTQGYLYVLGGDPGAGPNSASGLLAALGPCPVTGSFHDAVPFIWINEVSTVAAAYSMAGYATNATHVSSSGTPVALTGVANAFANATNLAGISTGNALATTPAGNGTVPQSTINTLANILAACVNSTGPGSAPCSTLFATALSNGTTGSAPTDTANAILNIAHNPGANVAALFSIPSPTPAFAPALSTQPNDFTLALQFTGGGITSANHIAIDSTGSVWTSNSTALAKLSHLGAAISPSSGYTDSSLNAAAGLAIDASDNVWAANSGDHTLTEFSTTGQYLTVASAPLNTLYFPRVAAIDATGNLWVPTSNGITSNLVEFASNGNHIQNILSGLLTGPQSIAINGAGNIFVANNDSTIGKFSSAGLPNTLPYFGGGINLPVSIAIDASSDIWSLNSDASLGAITSTGAAVSGAPYNTGTLGSGQSMAIDGSDNAWFLSGSTLYAVSNSGTLLPGAGGIAPIANASDLAIDASGDIWIAAGATVSEIVGVAAPITTPVSAAVKNNTVATLP